MQITSPILRGVSPCKAQPTSAHTDPAGLLLFHATPERFPRFATDNEGAHFGSLDQALALRKVGKRYLICADVKIACPLRVPDLGAWSFPGVHAYLSRTGILTDQEADAVWTMWQLGDESGWTAVKTALRAKGYDGFIYANEQEGPGDSFVAFWPDQIRIVSRTRLTSLAMRSPRSSATSAP